MRWDYHKIIFGSFFLIYSMVYYLLHPSLVYVPSSLALLTVIVSGVFEFKKYYNKYAYMVFVVLILVLIWLLNFIQPPSTYKEIILYYFAAGVCTLLILGLAVLTLKRWIKNENTLKECDEALRINPDDINALNNKGAVLTVMREYDEAMECFDRVLEIAPEDGIVLQNKNILEMKLQNKTFSKQVSDNPQLEIVEGEGKSILKIKKK